MSQFLFQYYAIPPTTWAYLASLLMIGLFFKFNRLWSVRNADLVLLALLAPGLLLVHFGKLLDQREAATAAVSEDAAPGDTIETATPDVDTAPLAANDEASVAPPVESVVNSELSPDEAATVEEAVRSGMTPRDTQFTGYLWLLCVLGLFLIRLLVDPTMVRRPLLEPNLAPGGMAFLGCSLFVFIMANVVTSPLTDDDLSGARSADQLLSASANGESTDNLRRHGPGNAILHSIPSLVTMPLHWEDAQQTEARRHMTVAKLMAITTHVVVVVGMVLIGYWHFSNVKMGVGAATLYLMLPYTSQMAGHVNHVLPASLLVCAILCYRRPLGAGMLIGLAAGVAYYPLFLLPLWVSFYWKRGLTRFLSGVSATLCVSVLSLVFVSASVTEFWMNVRRMLGIWLPFGSDLELEGIWGNGWDPLYRIPILAAFIVLSVTLAFWPAQKNLGTLLSCSAAVMVGTQFWHGHGGGEYMAWFLPLVLLTIFRPNLEDRVALSVLGEGWFPKKRRSQMNRVDQAA